MPDAQEQVGEGIEVRWPEEASTAPAVFVNVFALQGQPDGLVINFGQAAQPIGTPISELAEITAVPVIRLVMPYERAREVATGMAAILHNIDEMVAQQKEQQS